MGKRETFFDVSALLAPAAGESTSPDEARAPAPVPTGQPAYQRLYEQLRAAVLTGRLKPGMRVPSTRALASSLGLSRTTVVSAFEQLRAEGYFEGQVGSGTRVAGTLPEDLLMFQRAPAAAHDGARTEPGTRHQAGSRRVSAHAAAPDGPPARSLAAARSAVATRTALSTPGAAGAVPPLSARGRALIVPPVSETRLARTVRAFRPNVPALDEFPTALWARVAARRYRRLASPLLTDGDPRGYGPLRTEVAAYVGAVRGVRCEPEQVVIVAGSQQGIQLAARVCLDPGDAVWFEDPGYPGARRALADAGARVVPVPVDGEGLDVAAGARLAPAARMAFVTPAHQAPLGVPMSATRRLALLEWARAANAWVLEDDYDSEYRYAGLPFPALQGLDPDGRVIYLGTFSKTLFPALRLGYLVIPMVLVDAVAGARAVIDRHSPVIDQAVVADFIAGGHFARHVRRMRTLYAERQAALLEAGRRELAGLVDLAPSDAGLHLIGWLPAGVDDRAAQEAALAAGVDTLSLSAHRAAPPAPVAGPGARTGLLLGYAPVRPARIHVAASSLARALAPLARGQRPR